MANAGPNTNGSQVRALASALALASLLCSDLASVFSTNQLYMLSSAMHTTVFCDAGPNAVAGWQAHNIWAGI